MPDLERLLALWEEVRPGSWPISKSVLRYGRILVAGAVLLGGGYTAYRYGPALPSFGGMNTYLPEGFDELKMGMSLEEVMKERPKATTEQEEFLGENDITAFGEFFFGDVPYNGTSHLQMNLAGEKMRRVTEMMVHYSFMKDKLYGVTFELVIRGCRQGYYDDSDDIAPFLRYGKMNFGMTTEGASAGWQAIYHKDKDVVQGLQYRSNLAGCTLQYYVETP